jgi:chromatin assembly factor 1 subunit A
VPVDVIQNPTINPVSLALDVPTQDTNSAPASPQKTAVGKAQSDYDRYFLPFSLPSHAILAPHNRFMDDPAMLAKASARLDQLVSGVKSTEPVTVESLKASFSTSGPRGVKTIPILEIVELVNGTSEKPIDLTSDRDPLDLLKQIPMKYLHFPRDVRPPYYGTYTKPHTHHEELKLARNPFSRTLRDCNYDYDSEAEWDEPEEGEDLDSEGDDDLDDEVEDEFDGFLDDDEDHQLKRRHISGDLEPISTGLCWEDGRGVSRINDGSGAISTDFKEFEMGFLLGMLTYPPLSKLI